MRRDSVPLFLKRRNPTASAATLAALLPDAERARVEAMRAGEALLLALPRPLTKVSKRPS
jgi:hypothetical protein